MSEKEMIGEFNHKIESCCKGLTWKIENFPDYLYIQKTLTYSFSFQTCMGSSVHEFKGGMRLERDGSNNLSMNFYVIPPEKSIYLRVNAWISDSKTTEQHNKIEWPARECKSVDLGAKSLGNLSEFVDGSEKSSLLDSSKTLTFHFEMYLYMMNKHMTNNDSIKIMKEIAQTEESKMPEYFAIYYDNPKFSDVTLLVGASEIPAHRMVLTAHSEYFARMFDSNFKEAKDKIVKIQEENEYIFKLMIKFIYTNNISELTFCIALEMIVLAQKYGFISLIAACNKLILENMNIVTCIDILSAVESAQSVDLKEKVTKFITANIKSVMKTKKWDELKEGNPTIAFEIATKAIDTKL